MYKFDPYWARLFFDGFQHKNIFSEFRAWSMHSIDFMPIIMNCIDVFLQAPCLRKFLST